MGAHPVTAVRAQAGGDNGYRIPSMTRERGVAFSRGELGAEISCVGVGVMLVGICFWVILGLSGSGEGVRARERGCAP